MLNARKQENINLCAMYMFFQLWARLSVGWALLNVIALLLHIILLQIELTESTFQTLYICKHNIIIEQYINYNGAFFNIEQFSCYLPFARNVSILN